jgi:hypothetical protein
MTCLERYKLDHGGLEPNIRDTCPNISGGIVIDDPPYCECGRKDECYECWNREIPTTAHPMESDPQPVDDIETVNHPKHYGREGAMECIDEMLLVFGTEPTMYFCLLNSWKYRYRAADKGGEEDLKKSDWYLAKYAELKGGD